MTLQKLLQNGYSVSAAYDADGVHNVIMTSKATHSMYWVQFDNSVLKLTDDDYEIPVTIRKFRS